MTHKDDTSNIKQNIPIILRICAIIILVMSIIGFLFFALASIYQLYNPGFLQNISSNNQYPHLVLYSIIQMVLHLAMFISALLILYLKKKGYYSLLITLILLLASQFFFENQITLAYIVISIIVIITISFFYRKLN